MQFDFSERLSKSLTDQFGIGFRSDLRKESDGLKLLIRPERVDIDEAFTLEIMIGWKKISLQFLPGKKAGFLLLDMGKSRIEQRAVFSAVAEKIINDNGSVILSINGVSFDRRFPDSWPQQWNQLSLSVKSPIIDADGDLLE